MIAHLRNYSGSLFIITLSLYFIFRDKVAFDPFRDILHIVQKLRQNKGNIDINEEYT